MRTTRPTCPTARGWTGVLAAGVLALAGCGESGPAETHAASADEASGSAAIIVDDAWVKAEETGMTAAFGVLVNNGDTDVQVISAETPAAADVELHEVAMVDGEMTMQEIQGGFRVPAGSTHTLEPGGDHLMLMDLSAPVEPGDDIAFVLMLADGSTIEFTAQAKDFAGADEEYAPGDEAGDGHDG